MEFKLELELENVSRPPSNCNDNNQWQWFPMKDNNQTLVVLNSWYCGLPEWIQRDLIVRFPEVKRESFSLPHPVVPSGNLFWDFYRWYYDLYDMFIYRDLMKDTLFLELTDAHREELTNLCNIGILKGGGCPPNMESVAHLESLFPTIREFLRKWSDCGVFVKLSHKSSKNDFKMYPSHTITDVFDNLVHSPEVSRNISKSSSIVLKPWNMKIKKPTEFRVFVENSKIIAVSQQEWHTHQPHLPLNINMFQQQLNLLIPNINRFYHDAVLDVNFAEDQLDLIEINPGCKWHSSGASLFRWDELEHGESPSIKFRVMIK